MADNKKNKLGLFRKSKNKRIENQWYKINILIVMAGFLITGQTAVDYIDGNGAILTAQNCIVNHGRLTDIKLNGTKTILSKCEINNETFVFLSERIGRKYYIEYRGFE